MQTVDRPETQAVLWPVVGVRDDPDYTVRMRKPSFPACVVCLCVPSVCLGWGRDGHRISAEIAAAHLSPAARVAVEALLDGAAMSDVANWADEIRDDPAYRWSEPLHYADVPAGEDRFILTRDCPAKGCVVSAIIRFDGALRGPGATAAERTEALKCLIHFVADAHQPMHVARAEDRGGNDVRVEFLGKRLNLHKVWDFALLDTVGKPWPAYAREIEAGLTAERVAEWSSTDPVVWANESYRLAVDHAYAIPDGGRLGRDYVERNIPIVNERLAKAGVRLAAMLNAIFADAAVPRAATVPATLPGAIPRMPSIREAAPVGR